MIPAPFDYAAPDSLEEAVALLAANPGARVLAGGDSLLRAMKLRQIRPAQLVDLRRIRGLRGIEARDGGGLGIGAMTTRADIAAHDGLRQSYAAVAEAAAALGDPQVRNRATLGGCLCVEEGDDLGAAMLAFDASVSLIGPDGRRVVATGEFLNAAGPRQGEILASVELPAVPGRQGSAYVSMRHPATLEAVCGVAARVNLSADGTVQECRVAVVGATSGPTRLHTMEAALQGRRASGEQIAAAAAEATQGLSFRSDLFASAEYRGHLTRVLARRALARAVERAG